MSTLTYGGTELRDLSAGHHWFSIEEGWRDGIEVRGVDATLAGTPGMYELNRIAKWRVIHLTGLVLATDEEDWDDEMTALEAVFDPTLGSRALVVSAPYMGLASGSRTISARVLNYITTEIVPQLVTSYDVTLNAIGNPPDWT